MKERRILILGGSGFIGSSLAAALVLEGYTDVTVVTELQNDKRIELFLKPEKERLKFRVADIRYYEQVESIVK